MTGTQTTEVGGGEAGGWRRRNVLGRARYPGALDTLGDTPLRVAFSKALLRVVAAWERVKLEGEALAVAAGVACWVVLHLVAAGKWRRDRDSNPR